MLFLGCSWCPSRLIDVSYSVWVGSIAAEARFKGIPGTVGKKRRHTSSTETSNWRLSKHRNISIIYQIMSVGRAGVHLQMGNTHHHILDPSKCSVSEPLPMKYTTLNVSPMLQGEL